jgi:hypothetical protein
MEQTMTAIDLSMARVPPASAPKRRTGRMLTVAAFTHLGLPAPAQSSAQFPLFNGSEEP